MLFTGTGMAPIQAAWAAASYAVPLSSKAARACNSFAEGAPDGFYEVTLYGTGCRAP